MTIALFASLGYLISAMLLYPNKKPSNSWLFVSMGVALGAHLMQVGYSLKGFMGDMSIMNVLTLTAVCMAVLGAIRYFLSADKITYTVVALVSSVCVWFPVFFEIPVAKVESWGLKVHVTFSIAAYIALGFAALYACFLLIKDSCLRRRKHVFGTGGLPLNYIERTMMSFTIFGEILLTLSLATGLIFIKEIWVQHVFNKIVFGVVSWIIIAIVLLRHYRQGFRGRQASWWLLLGFSCLMLSYFGTAFVLQIILR